MRAHLANADLVITGEGRIDHQTQYGKTPMGVVREAKKYNLPVIAIAGTLEQGYEELYELGFDAAADLIRRSASAIMRTWLLANRK